MSDFYRQADPQNVPVRPLNKGMMLHLPSNGLPMGACIDAANFIVGTNGARRRPVLGAFSSTPVEYPPVRDAVVFWKADGTQLALVLDTKYLYTLALSDGALTGVHWKYDTGTCSVSGVTVTGAGGASWTGQSIQNGDIMVLDRTGAGDGPESVPILSVDGATTITLQSAPSGTYGAGTLYEIRRIFRATEPNLVDMTLADNKIIFTDFDRPPRAFDGSTLGPLNAAITIKPQCCCHFLDRIFFGRILDSGTDYRQKLEWTGPLDRTTLSGDWIAYPYTAGFIRRILPLGPLLVMYMDDSIWMGRQTGYPSMPVVFSRFDTAGIGLIGMKAVTQWMDGHFAVADDDIYYFSPSGMEPIGTPIVKRSLRTCRNPWLVYVTPDPVNDRIVCGFPESSAEIARLWSFHTKAKAWSYDEVPCTALATSTMETGALTWGTYGTAPYATGTVTGTATTDQLDGNGTSWLANVSVGATVFIDTDSDGVYETVYTVKTVDGDTDITLNETITGSFSTKPYYTVNPEDSWGQIPYASWGTFGTKGTGVRRLYIGKDSYLYVLHADLTTDAGGSTVLATLETADYDEGAPDDDKTYRRLSLKIDRAVSVDLLFNVTGSTDGGQNWKQLGTIRIPSGKTEGRRTFKMTGSRARFKVVSSTAVESYTITELVYRRIPRGTEIHMD